MQTVKVFKLGSAQAVRIPARYRFNVDEVEVFERGGELVMRPKARTALDAFAPLMGLDIERQPQGELEPVEPLEL